MNLSVALTYASCGVRILPCREADSRCGTAKAPYVDGGTHRASASTAQVRAWWGRWPNAVVGLPCFANGLLVLDADRHGNGDGVHSLSLIFSQRGFNENTVPCVVTPRDGRHYIFRRPQGLGDTKAKLAPAVDVRDKGYVVAAGSIMATGKSYRLESGSVHQLAKAIASAMLLAAPRWMVEAVAKPAFPTCSQRVPLTLHADDIERRLAGLVKAVVLSKRGERNAILHWAACRAGELVDRGIVPAEVAFAMLVEAGRLAGLPRRESTATVRSGIRQASVNHGR